MKRIRSTLLAAMLGASVLLVGANPAAAETSFELRDTLILNADGSLTALISYSCPATSSYSVSVQVNVQQTKANATTVGSGYDSAYRSPSYSYGTLFCNGTLQTMALIVREQSGPGFATGKAFADVHFSHCDGIGCTTLRPDQFVRISK